jgi:hypothetical protein
MFFASMKGRVEISPVSAVLADPGHRTSLAFLADAPHKSLIFFILV